MPAEADPGVTEKGPLPENGPAPDLFSKVLPNSPLAGADEWPGGVWFDLNGWLTWAYGTLDGTVPGARDLAWSESKDDFSVQIVRQATDKLTLDWKLLI